MCIRDRLYTYLNVREDAMILYGFLTKDDLRVFKLLIGVNGIGPKGALAVLSVMTTDDLRFAVLGDDAKAIAKAPGIGAKTAQRVILELKDKLSLEEAFELKSEHVSRQNENGSSGVKNEAVQALVAVSYTHLVHRLLEVLLRLPREQPDLKDHEPQI